ncbi:hypothetical protein HMPREF0063_11931 [Aeromicrobium marinum DSM 15272]|uniref:Uncharacterized protein n=1 Tax=Aeromicrobium marinum DSM 15272 TaxID=585531 RepID=E2SDZ5_9ACTN|nr:hypothetical protein HMPREF0063_11931 [Aeromicrobium marinum DSM 15272]
MTNQETTMPDNIRRCRNCGCTDDEACWPFRCWWVDDDLCSGCDDGRGRDDE